MGAISNSDTEFVADAISPHKDNPAEAENLLNTETCEELFEDLAAWNTYLEDHVPCLSEEQDISQPQPLSPKPPF